MTFDEIRQRGEARRELEALKSKVPETHKHLFGDVVRRLKRCTRIDSYDQQKQSIYTDTQRILLRLAQEKK
jgi:hypothetical protein